MNLENKTILITGANGGLGKALVQEAIKLNAKKIYCAVRNIEQAKALEILSPIIELVELDLSNNESINDISSKIEDIDVLINNAGVNSGTRIFENKTIDFDINVIGTLHITKALNSKLKNNAAIINVTSVLALCNYPLMALYSASKAALHSITQALRAEMLLKNISVLEVLPGPMDTAMTKGADIAKSRPQDVALKIFKALENKEEEVYPDDFSQMVINELKEDKKTLIKNFAASIA